MRVYDFVRGGSVAGQMEFWIMPKQQQQSAIRANTSPHINSDTVITLFVFALCNRNLRSETEGGRINGFFFFFAAWMDQQLDLKNDFLVTLIIIISVAVSGCFITCLQVCLFFLLMKWS